MSEEFKCPYCEGTASIAYHRTGNNLLYCHDCEKTFSEVGAQIMKQAARIEELEAERDRLREALEEIISCQPEMCLARYCCRKCESMAGIARKALKGAGE